MFLQLAWAYVFLSGLSGAALTYYYDDEGNVKLLNILKYGLMLLGLGLVFCSTSMTEASATLCVLLLGSIPASIIWHKRYPDMCSSHASALSHNAWPVDMPSAVNVAMPLCTLTGHWLLLIHPIPHSLPFSLAQSTPCLPCLFDCLFILNHSCHSTDGEQAAKCKLAQ